MDAPADNKALVEEYRARTHRAELAVANIVAGCPGNLKVMELASILGKTIVPHGSDFSATFGVGRLTEFLEGNDNFCLEGYCPKNVKVIKFTLKARNLDMTPTPWPPRLRRDPVPPQHLIPAHHPALRPGQGLPEGVPDPRYVRTGERGHSSGPDPLGRSDSDIHFDMQLECDLTDFIGKAPDLTLTLDQDIEPHLAQVGLLPQHMGMRQWLLQRPAIFDVDGQRVSLTKQSIEYDRHLETQYVAFLQRLGRPAHISKDVVAYCKKNNIDMRAPGRLVSWLRSRHKVFKVDKEYVSLKPNFLRKYNPAEFGPPGFPAQDKSAAQGNAWQQGVRRSDEDQRVLYLEEKILNWLANKDKVTTTEMAEFAYAKHEELVPESWDANIFCQERAQLFRLSGFLHDQVELTETGRALTENKTRTAQSPNARQAEKRAAAALRNHQVTQALEPQAHQPNHRAAQANPRREGMQEAAELHKENIRLRQRCNVMETEIRALRYDLTAMQRHLHLPVSVSAMGVEEESINYRRKKSQIIVLGGHDGTAWLESVTTHRPLTKHWGRLAHLDSPRSFAAAETWRDSVYMMGGGDGNHWFSSVLRNDTAVHHARWTPVAPMKTERGSLAAVTVGDYIYAIGGGKPNMQYDTVERYDPYQDRWGSMPKLNTARFALSAAATHGALYAVGGFNGEQYMSSVEMLDPRVGRWDGLKYNMTYSRGSLAVTAMGDSVYAIGGFNSKEALHVVEVMDVRNNKWRSLSSLSTERAYGEAAVIADQIYVVGGLQTNMTSYAPFIEIYDPVMDHWELPPLPGDIEPRAFAAMCTL
ncbi:hypothetical protein ABBQ32_000123 [Trebouxia sp. C0010 RCD-2024]